MSIQTTFSKILTSGLADLISKLGTDVANELEFRLGSYEKNHFIPGQNSLQFKNIIENLQKKKYHLDEESSLDIILTGTAISEDLKNTRTTVSSLINVRKYCLSEKISTIDS